MRDARVEGTGSVASACASRSAWSARGWAIYLSFGLITLDGGALNLALPTIASQMHGDTAALSWVVDAYTLPLASLLLLAGSLGDRFGAARLLRIGAAGFALATVGCALSPTLGALIACRAVQGVFAAMLLPMVLALVGKSFPDGRSRVQAVNLITLFGGAGWAIGPSIGGLLTNTVGWRAVFWLTVPLAIAAALLVAPRTNERRQARAGRLDIAGQITGTTGLTFLVAGLIELGHDTSPRLTGGLLACGIVLLAAFITVQRRSSHPMMPLGVFAIATFRRSVIGGFIFQFAAYGLLFYLAVYLQSAWAVSAEFGGFLLITFAVGIMSASLLINPHVQRRGARRMILIGTLVAAPATLALLVATSSARWPVLMVDLLFVGAGCGIYSTGLNQVAGQALGAASSGLASGIYNTSRQIGMSIGIAILGVLVSLPDLRLGYVIAITAATVGIACIGTMELIGRASPALRTPSS